MRKLFKGGNYMRKYGMKNPKNQADDFYPKSIFITQNHKHNMSKAMILLLIRRLDEKNVLLNLSLLYIYKLLNYELTIYCIGGARCIPCYHGQGIP